MNQEITKLLRAKIYMDYLANGIDPVTNTGIDGDTLHNEKVIESLRYVSDILEKNICEAEMPQERHRSRKNGAFYITDEQVSMLNVFTYKCKVSELANEINRFAEVNSTKKMAASLINDWLEAEGYLCQSDLNSRIPTEKGEQLGISYEHKTRYDGNEYYINYYDPQAQRFVYEHINDILESRYVKLEDDVVPAQAIEYPSSVRVREFISQHNDKCFIMTIGSCDSVASKGSYIAVLHYKGKSKVLRGTNIPASSSIKVIHSGLLAAAESIKAPTDVVILSSAPFGFNTPRYKNYKSFKFCKDIYTILSEKKCNLYTAVCHGRGNEIAEFIRSLEVSEV